MLKVNRDRIDLPARFSRLREIDWDFAASDSQSFFSSLHWHPCRYPSQVPAVVIGSLSSPGETVLDPFLGSGTTAVEAQRLSRRSVGIEINPVAAQMARAKTLNRSSSHIRKTIEQIRIGARLTSRKAVVPKSVQASKWYTARTLSELQRLRFFIDNCEGDERLISETAFSAILMPVCRETRHWGYVCDNTAPKGDYERNVLEEFERTLDGFLDSYLERDSYWKSGPQYPSSYRNAHVLNGDAKVSLAKVPRDSVQLIVTSPPYFGVADYIKAQRLTLEWLGEDIEPLRVREIGARSKRHRLRAADEYLSDCQVIFKECRRVLQRRRACVVVFGESTERELVQTRFVQAVESCGFKLEQSVPRTISSRRRFSPRLNTEHILLFR